VRQFVGEDYALGFVHRATTERVMRALETGKLPATGGSLLRLLEGWVHVRRFDMALSIAGAGAAAWRPGDLAGRAGVGFVGRQLSEIGGGTAEMQRNIISERLLMMPREPAADRGVPFEQVRHNTAPRREG
jgi:alkylation response protein AidB-like acyl-CoA dehydrogenase